MNKIEKRIKLANEAKDLIIEYRNEESILGENVLKSISISEDGSIIYVDDIYDGLEEYNLNCISSIFKINMEGFGPCCARFYEAVDMSISDVEYEYKTKNKSREEFINYVGSLYYAQYRCEEIYNRLKEIDKEAEELI